MPPAQPDHPPEALQLGHMLVLIAWAGRQQTYARSAYMWSLCLYSTLSNAPLIDWHVPTCGPTKKDDLSQESHNSYTKKRKSSLGFCNEMHQTHILDIK